MDLLSENNKALEWCGGEARAPAMLEEWSILCSKVNSVLHQEVFSAQRSGGYSMKSQDLDHFLHFGQF